MATRVGCRRGCSSQSSGPEGRGAPHRGWKAGKEAVPRSYKHDELLPIPEGTGAGRDSYGIFIREGKSLVYQKHPLVANTVAQTKPNNRYILFIGIKASCSQIHTNALCTPQMSVLKES